MHQYMYYWDMANNANMNILLFLALNGEMCSGSWVALQWWHQDNVGQEVLGVDGCNAGGVGNGVKYGENLYEGRNDVQKG